MTAFKPSVFARRVLRKLASGGIARARPCGSYQLGATALPSGLMAELGQHDLVESAPSGEMVISVVGRAFVKRNLQGKHTSAVSCGSGGGDTKFMRQHQTVRSETRVVEGKKRKVHFDSAESPLGWLAQRKDNKGRSFLSPEQVMAGERLRFDFTAAGMAPRLTPKYDGVPVDTGSGRIYSGLNASEAQISARKRVTGAIAGVGPDLSDVLMRVCCYLEGLGEAERQLNWPARSGKLVLKIALDRLAGHYGLQ